MDFVHEKALNDAASSTYIEENEDNFEMADVSTDRQGTVVGADEI